MYIHTYICIYYVFCVNYKNIMQRILISAMFGEKPSKNVIILTITKGKNCVLLNP